MSQERFGPRHTKPGRFPRERIGTTTATARSDRMARSSGGSCPMRSRRESRSAASGADRSRRVATNVLSAENAGGSSAPMQYRASYPVRAIPKTMQVRVFRKAASRERFDRGQRALGEGPLSLGDRRGRPSAGPPGSAGADDPPAARASLRARTVTLMRRRTSIRGVRTRSVLLQILTP
jgi:hypothetical protein